MKLQIQNGSTKLADGITGALVVVGGVVLWIFDLIGAVGGFMYDNWSIISPVDLWCGCCTWSLCRLFTYDQWN